ncbi:hypothetical protein MOO46_06120 [Apilactobacillus apisilvae]|uniref:YxeA family protein n=1 Tax=Apilactobacillus apisilvae TaxID=2923364 RepID=A0ABY4PH75_9LACO|nr:hypothetical protein [Apilactobacillus apisilvae]UQS84819.1 hypothetical protein MOO46_06120 [Apilactobacillus apisilvae]
MKYNKIILIILTILIAFIGTIALLHHPKNQKVKRTEPITYKKLITSNHYYGQKYYLKNIHVNQQYIKNGRKEASVSDDDNHLYFLILKDKNLPQKNLSIKGTIDKYRILKTNLGYKYRYPVLVVN